MTILSLWKTVREGFHSACANAEERKWRKKYGNMIACCDNQVTILAGFRVERLGIIPFPALCSFYKSSSHESIGPVLPSHPCVRPRQVTF